MLTKIINYLLMVFNLYFLAGVIGGYVGKLVFGGKFVSVVTGLVVGLFLYDFVKHWVFKS